MLALKTLTLDVECSEIWVHAFNEECIWFFNDYVRMTRTGWCNLSGYKCSIPEREHSLVPHKTHRWTMLKNRLFHTSLSSNPATHTALHNTHRSRVLSFLALLLIRHINFTHQHTEVGMRHMEWVTAILFPHKVKKTFNRKVCCSVSASCREFLYLHRECELMDLYKFYRDIIFVANANRISPIK